MIPVVVPRSSSVLGNKPCPASRLRMMGASGVPMKAAQERLGHSRPDILLKFYAHVLDASADVDAPALSQGLGGRSASLEIAYKSVS